MELSLSYIFQEEIILANFFVVFFSIFLERHILPSLKQHRCIVISIYRALSPWSLLHQSLSRHKVIHRQHLNQSC